jgi:thymidine kinase
MAQLYFRFGAMNSGKSIEILKIAHNYEEAGKSVLLFAPRIDTRHGVGIVSSRIGLQREAIIIDADMITTVSLVRPDCVLVDEAQFLNKEQVEDLVFIVDHLNIPVIAYGLRSDFQASCDGVFEGSKFLFLMADKVEEIKTVCKHCNKKAMFNMRISETGEPVFNGGQLKLGGNDSYESVCRSCYMEAKYNNEMRMK